MAIDPAAFRSALGRFATGVTILTARDANSDALLDLFDFSCPAMASPPDPPAAGTGGCP